MEIAKVLCLVSFLCILLGSGEAYLAQRNIKVDTLDKRKDNEDVDNKVKKAAPRESVHNQRELLAMKDVETEIDDLLNKIEVEKSRLNKRVNKRGWFCEWCDGSKLLKMAAKSKKCKCKKRKKTSCKCPNGETLTKDMFDKIIRFRESDEIA